MTTSNAQDRRERVIEGMAIWGSYYRENIDEFVTDYLELDFLKWFQLALLVMMNRSRTFLWIAARGMGKSFLTAIFAVVRCILYPGTQVVITSGTRGQSINVLEKIQTILMPASPNLRNEIDLEKNAHQSDGQTIEQRDEYTTEHFAPVSYDNSKEGNGREKELFNDGVEPATQIEESLSPSITSAGTDSDCNSPESEAQPSSGLQADHHLDATATAQSETTADDAV